MEYVIAIGIDVQRKFIQVCLMDKAGGEQFNDRLDLRAGDEITTFFSSVPKGTEVATEGTLGWMWLADLVEGLGLTVHLAQWKAVRAIADSRLKTDKIDARALALPQPARSMLDDLLAHIAFLNQQIDRVGRRLDRSLGPDPRIEWLTSLPGVGKLTA